MVKMVFSFRVSQEKQDEYLEATFKKIKPFWESHGCDSYDVFQGIEDPDVFVKEMLFEDEKAMGTALTLKERDGEAKAVVDLWLTYIEDLVRTPYIKKT